MSRFSKTNCTVLLLLFAMLFVAGGCDQQAVEDVKDQAAKTAEAAGDAAEEMKSKLGEGLSAAAEKAQAALDGVDGGGELLTGLKDLFTSAQESLQGITDKASAEGASSEIDALISKVKGLAGQAEQLPEGAKTAIQGFATKGLEQLKALVDKIKAMPGVQEAIGPKLESLVEHVKAMTNTSNGT